MYVITHNDRVILGPMRWNARMFNAVIEDDLERDFNILYKPNILMSDEKKAPLTLEHDIVIRAYQEVREDLNPKLQHHNGPFWTFTASVATGTYIAVDKPVDLCRQQLKEQVAHKRWQRETSGVKLPLQGADVTISTSRDGRAAFVQSYLMLADDATVNWKFPEGWRTLSKAELGECVAACSSAVQAAFDWEAATIAALDACQTLSELDAVALE